MLIYSSSKPIISRCDNEINFLWFIAVNYKALKINISFSPSTLLKPLKFAQMFFEFFNLLQSDVSERALKVISCRRVCLKESTYYFFFVMRVDSVCE